MSGLGRPPSPVAEPSNEPSDASGSLVSSMTKRRLRLTERQTRTQAAHSIAHHGIAAARTLCHATQAAQYVPLLDRDHALGVLPPSNRVQS